MVKKQLYQSGHLLIIIVFTLLTYNSITHNQFSGLDDNKLIINQWSAFQSNQYLVNAFTNNVYLDPSGDYYRPLQLVSYKIDSWFSTFEEPSPVPFLRGNLFWLLMSLITIYTFLKRFFTSANFAFMITLLMVVHPATVQAVAWIPGRGEFILLIFSLSSMSAYILWLQTHRAVFIWIHSLLFFGALLSKETAVILPLIAICYSLLFGNLMWKKNTLKTNLLNLCKTHIALLICWVIPFIIWLVLRQNALSHVIGTTPFAFIEFVKLPLRTFLAISGILFPYPLAVIYGWSIVHFSISSLIISILAWISFKWHDKLSQLIFGSCWVIFFVAPTGIVSFTLYHRLFIGLVGVALIINSLKLPIKKSSKFILYLLLMGILSFMNHSFQKAFTTPLNFWTNANHNLPESILTISGLAWVNQTQNKPLKAAKLYEQAIKIDSTRPSIRINLASIYQEQKQFGKANDLLQQEYKHTKDSNLVAYYQGAFFLEQKDTLRAIPLLQKGLQITAYNHNAKQYYDTLQLDLSAK